jgi:Orsellinic acid/F9775 biosynthesis cluster protein D
LGISLRPSPTEVMNCCDPSCSFTHFASDKLQNHVQIAHNNNQQLSIELIAFNTSPFESPDSNESSEHANLASDEESTTDAFSSFSIGPVRGRQPHLSIRPSPYQRANEDSSRSASPIRRPSLGSLSPLHIPLSLAGPSGPSPLQKLAFSRANSPSPPLLDREMVVDETTSPMDEDEASLEHLFNEEDVLAKASFSIVLLPYLQTTPPARLIVCTKCRHGIIPTSLITHSTLHNIKLLPADKQNLQTIINNSTFLDDSIEIATPNPPCPPIEEIRLQDGFACELCRYCSPKAETMRNHFSKDHKGVLGFAKANSKPAKVQALFARRPKYFAVTPSLRGSTKRTCSPNT